MLTPENHRVLAELNAQILRNEQETVDLNFRIGDLLNEIASSQGVPMKDVSTLLETASGIPHTIFETNARIARRVKPACRPKNVPWGVIKYLTVDLNPTHFEVDEINFCKAASEALRHVGEKNLKLVDLRKKDGDRSVGELILKSKLAQ